MRPRPFYDRPYRSRPADGYDRSFTPHLGRYGTPLPGAHGYPSARWGWGPIGWAAWTPDEEPWPRDRHSARGIRATYGRTGDQELRRWVADRGYGEGHEISPRFRNQR